jgi:L-arabinose transport system substrate-binding protein
MVDAGLSEAVYERFSAAGVPVAFETLPIVDAEGKLLAPGVVLDTIQVGKNAAEWYIENLSDLGYDDTDWSTTGLLFGTNSIFVPTLERIDGFREVWDVKYPDFPAENIFVGDVAAEPTTGDDADALYNQSSAILAANPQIEKWICFAAVDDYAVGIARALEAANLTDKAVLVSSGGERAIPEWENDPASADYWVAESYFNAMQYAVHVVDALLDMVQNGTDPKDVLPDYKEAGNDYAMVAVAGDVVTPEDYKEYPDYLPGY